MVIPESTINIIHPQRGNDRMNRKNYNTAIVIDLTMTYKMLIYQTAR